MDPRRELELMMTRRQLFGRAATGIGVAEAVTAIAARVVRAVAADATADRAATVARGVSVKAAATTRARRPSSLRHS